MRTLQRAARDAGQLLIGAAVGLTAPLLVVLLALSVPTSLVAGLGIVVFGAAVWLLRRVAGVQRRRVLGVSAPAPYRPLPAGLLARTRVLAGDPGTWRDLAWVLCQFAAGVAGVAVGIGMWLAAVQCMTAPVLQVLLPDETSFDPAVLEVTRRSWVLTWLLVPLGFGLSLVAYRLPRHLLSGQARLAAALLGPTPAARSAELAARVDRLTETRAAAVDDSAVELRRIERDLHDGAQVRLVAVAMNIGMAQDFIDADPATAKALMAEAKAGAGTALAELRDLVRGIHPPVLADRGLVGAVQAIALSAGVPVELDLRLDRRLSAPVESAAYFAVAEGLSNAIRHSGAGRIRIAVDDLGRALRITVHDDGRGGADLSGGTGLRGIQRRLAAFDGTLRIASPAGGPTVLEMELPCGS